MSVDKVKEKNIPVQGDQNVLAFELRRDKSKVRWGMILTGGVILARVIVVRVRGKLCCTPISRAIWVAKV